MKIQRIAVYRVELPLHEGKYAWSGEKSVEVFDSTIVKVETESGITGVGRAAHNMRCTGRTDATYYAG